MGAAPALATTITIPAGYEAQITNTSLGGCDANADGYQLGSNAVVQLGSKAAGCSSPIAEPDETVGPVGSTQAFRLYLQDGTCNAVYYSDGTGTANHALVVDNGNGSYGVAIDDAGPGCAYQTSTVIPATANDGNFKATVAVVAAPPTVTVTAPAPSSGQGGYFNAADLAAAGGGISVSVSATEGTGTGMKSISCTDNGNATPVSNETGVGTATMTGKVNVSANGTHAIACIASSNASAPGNTGGANTATVAIDSTSPTLAVAANPLVVPATALDGAQVSSYPVSVSDSESDDTPAVSCFPAAPAHFPIGDSTVSCQATDRARNASTVQFVVRVPQPPPAAPSFGPVATAGPTATVTIACLGVSGQVCSGTLTATASGRAVAQAAFSAEAGASTVVTIVLDQVARRLLGKLYALTATLTLPGGATHRTTFRYVRIVAPVRFRARSSGSRTLFTSLTAAALPHGATVTVQCRGGPRCARTVKPKGRKLDLTSVVAHKLFPAGSEVIVTIAAPNRIAQVSVITARAHALPASTTLCRSPEAAAPTRCHA